LLLALIFVAAGGAKLADRPGTNRAIIDFGLPATFAGLLGILLPLAELTVAASLVPTATAWWGAIGALALLLLFVVGIGANLARGHKPHCHCFGQLYSAPAGWKTLLRNGALAVVAGFVVWKGKEGAGPSAVSWLGNLSTVQLVAIVVGLVVLSVVAAQWWFLVHLLRQNGRLLARLEVLEERRAADGVAPSQNGVPAQPAAGLPVGSQAPAFSLSGLYGETLTLESLRAPGRPLLLVFTDPNCGPCTAMLPEIGRWQKEQAEKLTVSLISRGDTEENRAKAAEHGLQHVLLQKDWEVGQAYQAAGTPSAALVRSDGTIGGPVAGGVEAIKALLAHAVGERAQLPMRPQAHGEPCPNCGKVHSAAGQAAQLPMPAGPKVGDPAPEIQLKNLKGKTVQLKDLRREETLVLFWNPGCGYCQEMLPNLKEWEANPPKGAPKLLVVSTGTKEANEEMGFRSPLVRDPEFAAARAFGAGGTPSAMLIDAEGKVASELALGAQAVLTLAGAGQVEA
jgi:methylamine dehydrogenase accessory protein MauD